MDGTEKQNVINSIVEVKVIKNNTSLQITVPQSWRVLHNVDVGDWLQLNLIKILKKCRKR